MRKTSRDIQAEQSKKRIYETGIALFAMNGFDNTSVSDICLEAECSVGAFYHHFSSKHALFDEAFEIADREFARRNCEDAVERSQPADRGAVIRYMEHYARLVNSNGLEFSKHFYTWSNKMFIKEGRAMQTCLAALLQRGVESGTLTLTIEPEAACEWLFVCARGIVFHWCLHEGGFDLVARMRESVDRLLAGIETRA